MNGPIFRLSGICFGYADRPPLFQGLDFSVSAGDRFGIIGPNGCGKTTLLNIIMGFIKPRSGRVEVAGRERCLERDFTEVRRMIGFLFQNSDDQLFCPSAREEVAFGPLNYRRSKMEVTDVVRESLAQVGLAGFEDRVPYRLSEGEKKRLAIAAVLAAQPDLLLLDEPTNGLDDEGVQKIEDILAARARTYVVVSQDRRFLGRTVERSFIIRQGRLEPAAL